MDTSQVQVFEDHRWAERVQPVVWRHEAALDLGIEGPVLDVGGGDGLFLSLLRERRGITDVSLIDLSPVAVEKARHRGIRASTSDITKPFPFPDGAFRTACALDVLEHLYDPSSTLNEMARVAHWIVLAVPNFHYWKDRGQMLMGRIPFQSKPRRGHVHWFNYATLRELIGRSELEIDRITFGGMRRLHPVGNWFARWYPNLFAHSYAVRLRKRG